MELKEGMYVRTKNGEIAKVVANSSYWVNIDKFKKDGMTLRTIRKIDILKASNNIIDLIEVGDYVNGVLVESIYSKEEDKMCFHTFETEIMIEVTKENINNIVTKEQFESMSYKIN